MLRMRYLGAMAAVCLISNAQTPCANCHPKIAATYAKTGMARSFYRPGTQASVEDYSRGNPYFHAPSATWYSMQQRGADLYQKRWRIGPTGQEIDAEESRIDYVMGSGNHVRTYLHATARGSLIELPLGWYAENGGQWAMSPGHDRDYMLPPRTIAYECMSCHNAYPRIPTGHDEPGAEPLYSGALPEGIDCQRCHGSGANHIRAAQTPGARVEDVRRAIVNPARLSLDRQMEVCMQCHLETTSLQLPHSIQRYNRAPFSYRPGQPLGDYMIFFDHAAGSKYADDFEIASSAYRLRKSQCFLKSAGKLTCTTCHNPHDVPHGAEAIAHYNGVCGQCHTGSLRSAIAVGKHTAEPDCLGCHMVKRRTQDVIHAAVTDHLIARHAPPNPLTPLAERPDFDNNQYRGEVVTYYPPALPLTGENALYPAVAQVTQNSNLEKGLARLNAEVIKQKPAQAAFYVELGLAWMSAGKPVSAITAFEQALVRKPNSAVALVDLADALTESKQPVRAVAALTRAIKAAPDDPLPWYQLGIAHTNASRANEAAAAFEKTIALDPDMAEAHTLLGAVLAGNGDLEGAGREMKRSLQINPDLPEAQSNMGHLLAVRGDLVMAAYYLGRSVQLRPNDGDAHLNYAVTLAGLTKLDEAMSQVDEAIRAAPKSAEPHNFKGTLLQRANKLDEALREFQEALRLRPGYGRARLNAGLTLAAKGDDAAAELYLRQAAKDADANVRTQAEAALKRLGR